MFTKAAAHIDLDLIACVGYSPMIASVILEQEDYEPDKVFIEFVDTLRSAFEEHEDG